jgi:hypothetical protein
MLKTLVLGLCALVLTASAGAAVTPQSATDLMLEQRLERQQAVVRHDKQVLRFFQRHRWLMRHPTHRTEASKQLRFYREQLRWTSLELITTQRAIDQREQQRRIARLHAASPANAIRVVFGRYAAEALAVARCESDLSVWAENGQYRGLFQMGHAERARYGHGTNAYLQAKAAHRYFVESGRSWAPWRCKPW